MDACTHRLVNSPKKLLALAFTLSFSTPPPSGAALAYLSAYHLPLPQQLASREELVPLSSSFRGTRKQSPSLSLFSVGFRYSSQGKNPKLQGCQCRTSGDWSWPFPTTVCVHGSVCDHHGCEQGTQLVGCCFATERKLTEENPTMKKHFNHFISGGWPEGSF